MTKTKKRALAIGLSVAAVIVAAADRANGVQDNT